MYIAKVISRGELVGHSLAHLFFGYDNNNGPKDPFLLHDSGVVGNAVNADSRRLSSRMQQNVKCVMNSPGLIPAEHTVSLYYLHILNGTRHYH